MKSHLLVLQHSHCKHIVKCVHFTNGSCCMFWVVRTKAQAAPWANALDNLQPPVPATGHALCHEQ